jgi:hypothetical protein
LQQPGRDREYPQIPFHVIAPPVTICYIGIHHPDRCSGQEQSAAAAAPEAIMRKQFLAVSVAVLAMVVVALAGDPWKEKKPAEWKQAEVDRILKDSPWAREFDVVTTNRDLGNSRTNELNNAASSVSDLSQGASGRRGRNSSQSGDAENSTRAITYHAQWYSSRTLRAAQARASEIAGSPVPADSPLLKVPQNYQVLVHGGDLRSLEKLGDEGLKKNSYLELKSTHQKLSPERIVILQARGRAIAIVFEFAKTNDSGAPVLPAGEKNVELVTASELLTLHFKFDVSKMADQNGSDL